MEWERPALGVSLAAPLTGRPWTPLPGQVSVHPPQTHRRWVQLTVRKFSLLPFARFLSHLYCYFLRIFL